MEKLSNELILKCKIAEENLKRVNYEIEECAIKAGRDPRSIQLLAATKTVSSEVINHCIGLGVNLIGENRVQELLSKYNNLNLSNCECHFIGNLQRNKVKKIIGKVNLIQSINSIELAKEVSKVSSQQGIKTDVLIEVNIANEKSKSGILINDLYELLYEVKNMNSISVIGLMLIPPICQDSKILRSYFYKMMQLFLDIKSKKLDNINMEILSMGMSLDYREAILEGSNMVRIGSAIFGIR